MPKANLTKKAVDQATATGKDYVLWDERLRGLGLRITKRGAKSYVFRYRMGGRGFPEKRITLGRPCAGLTPDQARKQAEICAYDVMKGVDPVEKRRDERRERLDLAFDAYVEAFVDRYLPEHWERSGQEAARLLRREVVPHFRSTPLPAISKRDVTALFDRLAPRVGIARNTANVLRKLFKWACERGDLERSPMEGIRLPKRTALRDRYLDDTEISALWEASARLNHPYTYRFFDPLSFCR